MAKTQNHPIGNDFKANVLQENIFELFQYAHDHVVRSTFPAANEGASRDIVIVDTGTAVHICIKTPRGWFKSAALATV